MWTPERLLDVSLFVRERDVESVTATLMRDAALHLNVQDSEHWTPDASWTERTEHYRELAARVDPVATKLELGPPDTETTEAATHHVRPTRDQPALDSDVLRLETRVGGWQEDRTAAERDLRDLEAARRQVEVLRPLDAPVDELRTLDHHHLVIGSLPSENVGRVAAALFQVAFVLIPLQRQVDRTLLVAATAREDGHVLDRALRSAFFEPVPLPARASGPPDQALAALDELLEEARDRLDRLEEQGRALAREVGPILQRVRARIHAALQICDAIRRFPFRDGVYVVGGYLPAARLEAVEHDLRDAAEAPLVIEALPPRGGADAGVPSLIRNPRWLRPFEVLVDTYGVTGYDELNPTLVAAAAFTFMFGLMFGDLGHGAILTAVAVLAVARGLRSATVLVTAGISSMVFGALYGVAFGAEVFHALWLQPLHSIFELLIAAVVAGVVILNLGMALNLISAARAGDRMRFWLGGSGVLGLSFYWTLIGGGVAVFQGWIATGVWLALLLPLAAVTMLREPIEATLRGHRANWSGSLVGGFFELFETVIGYLSNSLSFVRMGAFAVAHEGLSQMVLSYSGGATGWLVFLVGTVLIVGFEGLIVGIQSLRLSYYEFFGRFFQGRGTRFRPLAFSGGPDA